MEIIMQEITDLIVDVKNPVVMTGNFREFCDATKKRLQEINREPRTEEEFVTAKGMIKVCKSTEKKLDGAREVLLGKLGDAQKILAEFHGLSEETRNLRLDLNRAVTEEENRRKKRLLTEAVETAEGYFIGTPFTLSVAENTLLEKCLLKRSDGARREALEEVLGGIKESLNYMMCAYEENLSFLGSYPSSLFPDAEELATHPAAELQAEVGRRVLLREVEEKEERERIKKEAEAKARAKAAAEYEARIKAEKQAMEEAEAKARAEATAENEAKKQAEAETEEKAMAELAAEAAAKGKADKQVYAEDGVDAFVREIRGQSEPDVKEQVSQVAGKQVEVVPPPGFPGVEEAEEEVYIAKLTIKVTCSSPEKMEDLLDMMSKTGQVEVLEYYSINF